MLLGDAIDRGIDAVIVQDLGLIRLIRVVYPDLEIHGSTQITVHDAAGAAAVRDLGVVPRRPGAGELARRSARHS